MEASDVRRCAEEGELGRLGSAKLLCVLEAFEGWEPLADWNDLTFYMQHGGDSHRANRDCRRRAMAQPGPDVCRGRPSEGACGIFP